MTTVFPQSFLVTSYRLWLYVTYQIALLSLIFSHSRVTFIPASSSLSTTTLVPYARTDRNFFIENRGQFADGLVAIMLAQRAQLGIGYDGKLHLVFDDLPPITLTLVSKGYMPYPQVTLIGPLKTKVSFLYGGNDPNRWQSNIPVWEGVCITGLLPNLTVEIVIEKNRLRLKAIPEKTIPNLHDLQKIQLLVSNAEVIGIRDSELEVQTNNRSLYLPLLEIWDRSDTPSYIKPIVIDSQVVGTPFVSPAKDPKLSLTSANVAQMLAASTFLGSRLERIGSETATVLALDRQNNVVVAGETQSPNFPTTVGAYDPTHNGRSDAFIAKLSSDLKTLLAATFFGGKDHEYITAFTFDSQNNLVVTGNTYSSDFPNTQGAYDITYDGRGDVFIAKLSGDLSTLHAATFLGGTKSDEANAVTVDRQNNIIVTGQTWSLDFPIMAEAYDSTPDVQSDAFVAKLSGNLKTLLTVTFIGGSDWDIANKLVLDNHSNIMVAGFTTSRDFPTTIGSYNTKHNGLYDIFVARLSDNLTTLENATFFGGKYNDLVTALALDDSGHVWIAGNTQSPDFPTTAAAYDQTPNGRTDVFVARLSKTLTTLENATFLGGRDDDLVTALALDDSGHVWIAGNTQSPDFPTTAAAYDQTLDGRTDVFVARLSKTLTTLENATFLGGSLFETATGLVLNVYSDILVTGWTISPDFPTTVKSYDPTYNGDKDVFIAKITFISQKQMTPVLNDRQRLQLLAPAIGNKIS